MKYLLITWGRNTGVACSFVEADTQQLAVTQMLMAVGDLTNELVYSNSRRAQIDELPTDPATLVRLIDEAVSSTLSELTYSVYVNTQPTNSKTNSKTNSTKMMVYVFELPIEMAHEVPNLLRAVTKLHAS